MKKILPCFTLTLWCALCFLLTPAQASAYIDPSTTTFIIQAGIGLVVAIAAGFSIYWRKAKKKISKAVGKDDSESEYHQEGCYLEVHPRKPQLF